MSPTLKGIDSGMRKPLIHRILPSFLTSACSLLRLTCAPNG